MFGSASGKNLVSGLLLVSIAAFAAYAARGLAVTSGGNMGPGYVPMVLSGLLAALGLAIIFTGGRRTDPGSLATSPSPRPFPWRGTIFVMAALIVFAVGVRPLGLGPALAGAVLLASLASRRWRPVPALTLTAAMVAVAWSLFIRLLGMPVAFLGPLLR